MSNLCDLLTLLGCLARQTCTWVAIYLNYVRSASCRRGTSAPIPECASTRSRKPPAQVQKDFCCEGRVPMRLANRQAPRRWGESSMMQPLLSSNSRRVLRCTCANANRHEQGHTLGERLAGACMAWFVDRVRTALPLLAPPSVRADATQLPCPAAAGRQLAKQAAAAACAAALLAGGPAAWGAEDGTLVR